MLLCIIPTLSLILLNSKQASAETYFNDKFIAHAMGEIDGISYTNSLEAFTENYNKGFRIFEVDLIMTSDNRLVAKHDWSDTNNVSLSYSEFMSLKINNKYTPLDFETIISLMQKYPNIHIITNTKDTDKANVVKTFQYIKQISSKIEPLALNRIIPQIYNQEMYRWVTGVYNFSDIIYTLYQSSDSDDEVISFVLQHHITKVTISESRFSSDLTNKLKIMKIKTYIHTINSQESMKSYESKNVFGFYTDSIYIQKNRQIKSALSKMFSSI